MKSKLVSSCDYLAVSKKCAFIFGKIWKECSTLLLHGSRNADKTSEAVDIAVKVASEGREVVYVDTQHQLYEHAEKLATVQNLFILEPQYDDPADPRDYADLVISSIEEIIKTTDIRVFVIDSITRIAGLSFGRNASPSYIMKRLAAIQIRYGVSLLVIAHDTTKAADRAIASLADICLEVAEPQQEEPSAGEMIQATAVTEPQHDNRQLSRRQRRAQKRLAKRRAERQVTDAR